MMFENLEIKDRGPVLCANSVISGVSFDFCCGRIKIFNHREHEGARRYKNDHVNKIKRGALAN